MRHKVHDRIFLYTSMAVAFFLPLFPRLVPVLIIIMVTNWLADGRFVQGFRNLFRERQRWQLLSLASFYLLYLVGMLWTTNREFGWFDLEVKLSLLIFPLIFSTIPAIPAGYRDRVLFAFVAGSVAGALILLGHAMVRYHITNDSYAFFYIPLSWYFHASYLSIYYTFAMVFLLVKYQEMPKENPVRRLILPGVVLLMVMVMLLSSKAGVLGMLLMVTIVSVSSMVARRSLLPGVSFLTLLLAVMVASYLFAPRVYYRLGALQQAMSAGSGTERSKAESTADRMDVWRSAVQLIGNNFWTGTGTGDVKDALVHEYSARQMLPAYKHRLNAHNQYLQTFITLGIGGFVLLVLMIVLPAWDALRGGDMVFLLFLLLFAFNILFESMLEGQAGVVFYAFFNTLLLATIKKRGDR